MREESDMVIDGDALDPKLISLHLLTLWLAQPWLRGPSKNVDQYLTAANL